MGQRLIIAAIVILAISIVGAVLPADPADIVDLLRSLWSKLQDRTRLGVLVAYGGSVLVLASQTRSIMDRLFGVVSAAGPVSTANSRVATATYYTFAVLLVVYQVFASLFILLASVSLWWAAWNSYTISLYLGITATSKALVATIVAFAAPVQIIKMTFVEAGTIWNRFVGAISNRSSVEGFALLAGVVLFTVGTAMQIFG